MAGPRRVRQDVVNTMVGVNMAAAIKSLVMAPAMEAVF